MARMKAVVRHRGRSEPVDVEKSWDEAGIRGEKANPNLGDSS